MYSVPCCLGAQVAGDWDAMLYPYLQTQLICFYRYPPLFFVLVVFPRRYTGLPDFVITRFTQGNYQFCQHELTSKNFKFFSVSKTCYTCSCSYAFIQVTIFSLI